MFCILLIPFVAIYTYRPFVFICYQILQVNLQDNSYLLQRIQVRLNPVAGIGIHHTETFAKLLGQPDLGYAFLC